MKSGNHFCLVHTTYLLVRRRDRVATGPCNSSTIVSDDESWTLLRLSRNGQLSSVVVDQCEMSCGSLIEPQQLLPDGIGGLVLNVKRFISSQLPYEGRLIRFDADSVRSDHVLPTVARIDLVGQRGVLYLQTSDTTQAFNVQAATSVWTTSPPLSLVAAHPDAGAAAQSSTGILQLIDTTDSSPGRCSQRLQGSCSDRGRGLAMVQGSGVSGTFRRDSIQRDACARWCEFL